MLKVTTPTGFLFTVLIFIATFTWLSNVMLTDMGLVPPVEEMEIMDTEVITQAFSENRTLLEQVGDIKDFGVSLFSGIFTIILYLPRQYAILIANGLVVIIFIFFAPLLAVMAYIIFRAIRGGG